MISFRTTGLSSFVVTAVPNAAPTAPPPMAPSTAASVTLPADAVMQVEATMKKPAIELLFILALLRSCTRKHGVFTYRLVPDYTENLSQKLSPRGDDLRKPFITVRDVAVV